MQAAFLPKSNAFIFCSFVQLSVVMDTIGVYHSSVNLIRSLKRCPKNKFFTIETFHITDKINEFSLKIAFKLFTISTMKKRESSRLENGINIVGGYQLKSRPC